jgi:hypothetical protein
VVEEVAVVAGVLVADLLHRVPGVVELHVDLDALAPALPVGVRVDGRVAVAAGDFVEELEPDLVGVHEDAVQIEQNCLATSADHIRSATACLLPPACSLPRMSLR